MRFIEYADTPEQMREKIVAYLRAAAKRHDPFGVHGKRLAEREAARRQALNEEADFIESLVIRPQSAREHDYRDDEKLPKRAEYDLDLDR